MFVVGRLTADLNCIPLSEFPRAVLKPGGKPFYVASFKVALIIESSLTFKYYYRGQEYASISAQYE